MLPFMLPFIIGFWIFFGAVSMVVGFLMLVAPGKYSYFGFLNGRMMERETTERGKRLAIRTQGFGMFALGTLIACAFYIWFVL